MRIDNTTDFRGQLLDENDDIENRILETLRADPRIEFLDLREQQRAGLEAILPPPEGDLLAEPTRWVYYPWRWAVVGLLGPRAFRTLRLDRNRNKITRAEQDRLGRFTIGVVGLSVGHAIAHTLALEGVCGELHLADFDEIDLSNLNRIPATLLDLGVNKAVVAARRIAELDPYLRVSVFTSGITSDTIDSFFDGLDLVVEECDSLEIKVLVRDAARARRVPLVMETSDRGLLDVERYDLEPERPPFHGLLGDGFDFAGLSELSPGDKIPHLYRILDGAELSPRMIASLPEVGKTISTWPQLGGDVALGGATVVAAARRVGLGEHLASGRVRVDVEAALDRMCEPSVKEHAT